MQRDTCAAEFLGWSNVQRVFVLEPGEPAEHCGAFVLDLGAVVPRPGFGRTVPKDAAVQGAGFAGPDEDGKDKVTKVAERISFCPRTIPTSYIGVACGVIWRNSFVDIWRSVEHSTLSDDQAVSCCLNDLCRKGLKVVYFEDPLNLSEEPVSRCTQIADFELEDLFTAVKWRTKKVSVHLNRGQTVVGRNRL